MKKKVYTLLSPDQDTNSYNWSFWEDRALVRVESKNYRSKIVQYKFDHVNKTLTDPETILEDPYFSLEDPRLISKNSFTYVKYDRENVACYLMKDDKPLTSGHAWEKNWQFIDQEKYFYKIKPLVIKGPNYKERFEYNMDWEYGDVFHLSSNMFEINDRQFIIFHSYKGLTVNTRRYYQGVVELENLRPKFYVPKPLFYPPTKTNPYKFKKNKNKCVFVMCVRIINEELYITAGINDCECALITINAQDFIRWVDQRKDFIEEISTTSPINGLREYQSFYRLGDENNLLL
tara:strand:- start:1047 stop:1916 length:870 start_codon:yes stop_codon:yes gene_type:complete